MMAPQVSIIIPAYNAMRYIEETLSSVFKQTWDDYEVIIVDDGSEDHFQKWSQTIVDKRVRIIHQRNQGLSNARNTGIYHAYGQYVAFLDADDLWVASKLEDQINLIRQNPKVGLVYSWVEFVDSQGISTGRKFSPYFSGQVWKQLSLDDFIGCGSNALVKRECFEQCGLFDESLQSYVEDWDMWLRIAQKFEFDVVPKTQVLYRQHENSVSRNWGSMEKNFLQVIEKNFRIAPFQSQKLKQQALGLAYLYLAWQPLHSKNKDVQEAIKFQKIALQFNSNLYFTKEYTRLTLAIVLMRFLGSKNFGLALKMLRSVRCWVITLFESYV